MTLVRSVAPVTKPIEVADVKAQMRVLEDDEDAFIQTLIDAAIAYVDARGVLGRCMITQTWQQWVSQSPGWVTLELGPNATLTEVHYHDTDGTLQEGTLSNFETRLAGDFNVVKPKDGFSWPQAQTRDDAIRLTYTAGYGGADAVPAGLKAALKLLVAHWYENREAVGAAAQEIPLGFRELIGVERVGWYG